MELMEISGIDVRYSCTMHFSATEKTSAHRILHLSRSYLSLCLNANQSPRLTWPL